MSGFLLPVRRLAHLFSSFDVSRVRCMYLARPAFSAPFPSFVLFSFSFCLMPSKCIFFSPSPLVCLSLCPTTLPFTYRRILHVCLWGSAGRVETETTERCMFFFFPFPFFSFLKKRKYFGCGAWRILYDVGAKMYGICVAQGCGVFIFLLCRALSAFFSIFFTSCVCVCVYESRSRVDQRWK
ncbi:unnamed protein product [Trypanosoma congolense IL3000]|uniref:WGS project CAEQ00000000 data, annotated contig 40 n=1 Tax=Trypanosoma congolense (strain IL3000) TaxID=1068625 RepID=F9WFM5_TRYCI|nr:unnamed protein product [Trypanosoma congolense IL3000]